MSAVTVVSRKQYFVALLPILQILCSFFPLFRISPEP